MKLNSIWTALYLLEPILWDFELYSSQNLFLIENK